VQNFSLKPGYLIDSFHQSFYIFLQRFEITLIPLQLLVDWIKLLPRIHLMKFVLLLDFLDLFISGFIFFDEVAIVILNCSDFAVCWEDLFPVGLTTWLNMRKDLRLDFWSWDLTFISRSFCCDRYRRAPLSYFSSPIGSFFISKGSDIFDSDWCTCSWIHWEIRLVFLSMLLGWAANP
jgi:hypothetical protein